MSCVHKVRWSVKRPEDCRFRLSVSHYKDRIVAPDEYTGATEVTPSSETQVLETKDKLVREDITVEGITGTQVITENGTYDVVGDKSVTVDIPVPAPVTESLSVTENGTYVPPSGVDGFDEVVVNVPTGGFPSYDDVVLPSEYQRVEYIESSGTQFINLPYGFLPTDTVDILASFNVLATDKSIVSPTRWNNDKNRFSPYYCQEMHGEMCFSVGYGNNPTGNTLFALKSVADTDLHRVVYSDLVFVMTDKGISLGAGNSAFGVETYPLRLFYGYDANTSGKMSHFVHTKADNRKIALFACYRKSDGVIGMYDVENDVFYTNDGTGDFTKGQDI